MSQAKEFHTLHDPSDGLFRELAPGLTTRIFSGEHVMLSVVTLAPNSEGLMHHHPRSSGVFCSKARLFVIRAANRFR
jgi:hypothetical protein